MAVGNVTMGLFYCFLGGDWAQEVPEGILLQGVGADLVVGLAEKHELQGLNMVTHAISLASHSLDTAKFMAGNAEVDFVISHVRVSHELSEYIDFSFPTYFLEQYRIISSNRATFNGDIVSGVYDKTSYTLVLLTSLTLAIMLYLTGGKQKTLTDLITTVFVIFNQPCPQSTMRRMNKSGGVRKFILSFSFLHSVFIVLMYNSVVISMLSRQDLMVKVDSVDDLINTYTDKLIYVVEKSYEDQALSATPLRSRLIRHPLFKPPELMKTYFQDIKDGTHVAIMYKPVMEMDLDLQPSIKGLFNIDDFRYSKEPVTNALGATDAWAYRKYFPLREMFDYYIMHRHAVGLITPQYPKALTMLYQAPEELFFPQPMGIPCPGQATRVNLGRYEDRPKARPRPPFPLAIHHIRTLFYYLGAGLCCGFIVFSCELAFDSVLNF